MTVSLERVLADVRQIRADLEAIRDAMMGSERPSAEDAGIAFVCAEAAIDIAHALELDVILDEVRASGGGQPPEGAA